MNKDRISHVLNILIVVFVPLAWMIMYFGLADSGSLASIGIWSLRYYTVLSNVFAMVTSLVFLISKLSGGDKADVFFWKYVAACTVGLTFLVVVVFLGPTAKNGYLSMFAGANFFFHLIVPLLAMADVMFFCKKEIMIPFKVSLFPSVTVLIYGTFYLGNVIINGRGEGDDINDWYGFVTWGLPAGLVIFAVIVFVIWLIAMYIRIIHNKNEE